MIKPKYLTILLLVAIVGLAVYVIPNRGKIKVGDNYLFDSSDVSVANLEIDAGTTKTTKTTKTAPVPPMQQKPAPTKILPIPSTAAKPLGGKPAVAPPTNNAPVQAVETQKGKPIVKPTPAPVNNSPQKLKDGECARTPDRGQCSSGNISNVQKSECQSGYKCGVIKPLTPPVVSDPKINKGDLGGKPNTSNNLGIKVLQTNVTNAAILESKCNAAKETQAECAVGTTKEITNKGGLKLSCSCKEKQFTIKLGESACTIKKTSWVCNNPTARMENQPQIGQTCGGGRKVTDVASCAPSNVAKPIGPNSVCCRVNTGVTTSIVQNTANNIADTADINNTIDSKATSIVDTINDGDTYPEIIGGEKCVAGGNITCATRICCTSLNANRCAFWANAEQTIGTCAIGEAYIAPDTTTTGQPVITVPDNSLEL